nr:3' terminal RNA ribose 2'-O-methyltransferase Hen1 [Plantactinospora sp. KBS50]
MLLTISTTRVPATDLGFLLVKHPDRVQSFTTTGGTAYVWYPEATPQRCTAALLLDVDPVGLARPAKGQRSPDGFSLGRYVNDRPYAASSLLTVALGRVFRSALNGTSRDRPELVGTALPLEIQVAALPCRGGPEVARQLFAPLGWTVTATPVPLDPEFPGWGDSPYVQLTLVGTRTLADALNHLYVLLPVLDDAKHYWVSADEVDKLLRAGAGWLERHPAKALIARRYLANRRSLMMTALERLQAAGDEPAAMIDAAATDGTATGTATDDTADDEAAADETAADDGAAATTAGGAAEASGGGTATGETGRGAALVRLRRDAVLAVLAESGARRVLDLGCGPGGLLPELLADRQYTEIVGADVSSVSLRIAERRLRLDRLPERQRDRIRLIQTALTYRDDRLRGYDAAILMEVIEHVDEARLPALEGPCSGTPARPR